MNTPTQGFNMKKWLFLICLTLAGSAFGKDLALFTVEGRSEDGNWHVVAMYSSKQKPVLEHYRDCLRQYCSGDMYDGTYQCEECREYSVMKERVNWSIDIETSFYYKNELKTTNTYSHWFHEDKMDKPYYTLFATNGFLYSQSCPDRNCCFALFASINDSSKELIVGYLTENLDPVISIIGKKMVGHLNIPKDYPNVTKLPATFVIKRGL
jgi:hypothetical protein